MKYLFLVTCIFYASFSLAQTHLDFSLEHEPGELLIKYKNATKSDALASFDFSSQSQISENTVLVKLNTRSDLKTLATEIASLPNVEHVELNLIYHLQQIPNDPSFRNQYALSSSQVNATSAWNLTTGSKNVLVAILDTGIDYTHPDIIDNYFFNYGEIGTDSRGRNKKANGVDDDKNGYIDDYMGWDFYNNDNNPRDYHSHGTHVAGIIGAKGNNRRGIAGTNWTVSMISLKIFSDNGRSTNSATILRALNYARKIGADVTNNSWGAIGSYSNLIRKAFERLDSQGIISVFGAGNDSNNNDLNPFYPSNYNLKNSISVAATDSRNLLASFSNYGAYSVDIAAPGVSILSTVLNGRYGYKRGSSMAAPYVTGAVALLKARYPSASSSTIKARILNGADRFGSLNGRVNNQRRLNIYNSLR